MTSIICISPSLPALSCPERLPHAAAAAERLRRLEPALALPLEHLQLLVIVQGPLQLLLRRAETGEDQAKSVPARLVARDHGLLELVLEARDQAHYGNPAVWPPSTCQWRWKIVWPAPSPTLTTTR